MWVTLALALGAIGTAGAGLYGLHSVNQANATAQENDKAIEAVAQQNKPISLHFANLALLTLGAGGVALFVWYKKNS